MSPLNDLPNFHLNTDNDKIMSYHVIKVKRGNFPMLDLIIHYKNEEEGEYCINQCFTFKNKLSDEYLFIRNLSIYIQEPMEF